jgi:hypothetical protein
VKDKTNKEVRILVNVIELASLRIRPANPSCKEDNTKADWISRNIIGKC